MPYNPDANDDGYIGSPDLLSFLPLFGSQVGVDSSLTCDYDGTPVEEFMGAVWNEDIVIDSITFQYFTIDSAQVFTAGCPDPAWEVVSYERAYTLNGSGSPNLGYQRVWNGSRLGFLRLFIFTYQSSTGEFSWKLVDHEVLQQDLQSALGYYMSHAQTSGGRPHGRYLLGWELSMMGLVYILTIGTVS